MLHFGIRTPKGKGLRIRSHWSKPGRSSRN